MAKAATDGSAIAGLEVADLAQRFDNDWALVADQLGAFERGLSCHGADPNAAVILANRGQFRNTVQINDVVRKYKSHVQHRHQRLPASE